VGSVGAVEISGLQVSGRWQYNVGIACRDRQKRVVNQPGSAPPRNRSFDFLELAKEAPRLGEGELAVTTDNDMHDPVFPNGCAVCEVEVDPETGLAEIARYSVVDDVGRCINPLIVHGQTHGGIAQGGRRGDVGRMCRRSSLGPALVGFVHGLRDAPLE